MYPHPTDCAGGDAHCKRICQFRIPKDPFRIPIVTDSNTSFPNCDLVDELQGRRIEHRDFVASITGKSVFELGRQCYATNAWRISYRSDKPIVVRINNVYLVAVGQIEAASGAVDGYIVKAPT